MESIYSVYYNSLQSLFGVYRTDRNSGRLSVSKVKAPTF